MVVHWSRIAVAVVSVGIGMSSCSRNLAATTEATPATSSTPAAAVATNTSTSSSIVSGLPDFTTLVERYGVAVVNVAVIGKEQPVRDLSDDGQGSDPLADFFKRFGGEPPRGGGGGHSPMRGQGSGFIVSPMATF